MTPLHRPEPAGWASDRHRRSVTWIVALATVAIVFDGYDLVIYGAVLPTLLADPTALGTLDPGTAGALGSYALVGVLVGALTAGVVGDRMGRRRTMLTAIVWFSVGMGATALAPNIGTFGALRFLTGIGVGALVATVGAMIAEFAPADRRNVFNAIVYSGIPAGGVLASLAAITLEDSVGWRGLFWLGAHPLVLLLAYSQELQRGGEWVHIWRLVGQYSNLSVFDVRDNERLHEILWNLPLFPFMTVDVTPLATHPSAIASG